MNAFGTLNTAQRDQRQVQLVREAVQRAMARPVDARADKDLVRRLSRELHAGEEMVASQVATVRVLAVQQVAQRVRERAVAEGLPPAAAVRLLDLGGIKAVALATRDALERARVRQRQRLSGQAGLAEALELEQRSALMERYEQSDEQLAHDFEEAVREIADENTEQQRERMRA